MAKKLGKNFWGVFLGFAVSGGLLVYFFGQLDWNKFFQELYRVNLAYLPALMGLFLLSYWLRALRWKYLLPRSVEISFSRRFSASVLGSLASCIFPLRAGEFVRPWLISRKGDISFPLCFSTIVTERVFDVLAMLGLFVITIGQLESPPKALIYAAGGLASIAGIILLAMLLAIFAAPKLLAILRWGLKLIFSQTETGFPAKISHLAEEFIEGLGAIKNIPDLLVLVFLSYLLWVEFSLFFYVGLLAFGIDASFALANALNVCVALAVALPSAPGFVGTFQAGCKLAISELYHYSEEFALAYSVFVHCLQLGITAAAGGVLLWLEGLSISQLERGGKDSGM